MPLFRKRGNRFPPMFCCPSSPVICAMLKKSPFDPAVTVEMKRFSGSRFSFAILILSSTFFSIRSTLLANDSVDVLSVKRFLSSSIFCCWLSVNESIKLMEVLEVLEVLQIWETDGS